MGVLTNQRLWIAAFVSLASVVLSSCVIDDFLEARRQRALRAEFQALGEKCVRVNEPYALTQKCIVASDYTLSEPLPEMTPDRVRDMLTETIIDVKHCIGESCGQLWITVDLRGGGVVKRWEVRTSGHQGLPSNALN